MSEKNFGHLGTTFQQGLLKTIIEDKKFAVTIIDVIDSKYFDGPYFRYIMENIKELYETYKCIPNYDTLEQKIMKENSDVSGKINIDTLLGIKNMIIEHSGYIQDTSLNFCRQQVLKKALKESEEIMDNGDFENYNKIEDKIRKALQIGTTTHEVTDISEGVIESLEEDSRVPFPTGIVGIDNLLKGGIARGELAILLAPTGIGKTTWLAKVANTGYNTGINVLHIFFEDNMRDIRRKHYAVWTGMAPDEQPKHKHEIAAMVDDMQSKKKNFLKLVKYPSGTLSISDIRNKIRKLESEGYKIDLLVLDYIDCITTEGTMNGEEWKGEGSIMRSLESMTDEFNIAIWTATQGNRESMKAEVVTADQMGGNIKKAQVGHVVISIAKTLEQKENNLATVTLLKSRIGKDGVVFGNCLFNNEMLEIDTDTQNTLLGHAEVRAEQKKEHILDVYRKSLIAKEEMKQKKEEIREEVLGEIYPNRDFDKTVHAEAPPQGVGILSVVGTVDAPKSPTIFELTQEEKNKRLARLAMERKRKIAVGELETG
jgi:replicative DNA helicase